MKIKKSVACLCSAILLFCLCSFSANAQEETSTHLEEEVANLLSSLVVSDSLDANIVNAPVLGNKIDVYTLSDGNIIDTDFDFYPVLCQNRIIQVATHFSNGTISLGRSISEELNQFINQFGNQKFAIVYQENNLLFCMNDSFVSASQLLEHSSKSADFTINIKDYAKIADKLLLSDIFSDNKELPYLKNIDYQLRASNSLALPIPKIKQFTPNICWSGCIASIGNYLTNLTHTSRSLAIRYLGTVGWDRGASLDEISDAFQKVYSLDYVAYDGYIPTTTGIINLMSDDHPFVMGFVEAGGGAHVVAIRGYASSSQHFSVLYMDPWDGEYYTMSVAQDGVYKLQINGVTYDASGFVA